MDTNDQVTHDTEPMATHESTSDPAIQALLARIQDLETKLQAPARTSAPREICKRNHSTDNWKVTPKGVRYCTECYKELRLEQALKKLQAAGRV